VSTPGLWKTTAVIWSQYPGDSISLTDLARQADTGDAYCPLSQSVYVAAPGDDPDWDGTEFFREQDEQDPDGAPGPAAIAAAEPQASEPTLYVLTISHRHGDDISVHGSQAEATGTLAEFARYWWEEITAGTGRACPGVTAPPPEDDEEAIRIYFEHQHDESYAITPAADPRPGQPGREPAGTLVPAAARPARRNLPAETGDVLTGRIITPPEPLPDHAALDLIQEWLRDPEWGVGMLEDIAETVVRTGRSTASYPDDRPTWGRH
jgi:hypothetical protein